MKTDQQIIDALAIESSRLVLYLEEYAKDLHTQAEEWGKEGKWHFAAKTVDYAEFILGSMLPAIENDLIQNTKDNHG